MRLLLVLGIATAFAIPAFTQDFTAPPGAPAKIFPKPQRPVADIVGPIWYEEKERDVARETQQVVRLLGIKSGMTIADIGAGSGYYVVRLAPIVGASGRIFAEDVVPEYLRALRKRLRKRGLQNVTIILGEPHDASLPAHSIDRAILVHMYHEIAQPYGLVYNLVTAFKPGARLGIVDAIAPTSQHGTPPNLLRCELAVVGYREIAFHPLSGSSAYLAIFAPPSEKDRTRPEAMNACHTNKAELKRRSHPVGDFRLILDPPLKEWRVFSDTTRRQDYATGMVAAEGTDLAVLRRHCRSQTTDRISCLLRALSRQSGTAK